VGLASCAVYQGPQLVPFTCYRAQGAGTGRATKGVLEHINEDFLFHTLTDISMGFFSTLPRSRSSSPTIEAKCYSIIVDAEHDPISQRFLEHKIQTNYRIFRHLGH